MKNEPWIQNTIIYQKLTNMQRREFFQRMSGGAALVPVLQESLHAGCLFSNVLAEHVIETINTRKLRIYYPRYVSMNSRRGPHGCEFDDTIVEIFTNQGASGFGVPLWRTSEKEARDFLKGKKVSDVFDISSGTRDTRAAFCDIALYDLAGKILNKPVYEILGTTRPQLFKCYSGMVYFDDLTRFYNRPIGIDLLLKECDFDYAVGYRQFKLKIGRGFKYSEKKIGMERDIEATKAVAKAFPDCEVLVDVNDGYSIQEMEEYLTGIQDVKLFWIEEPFVENLKDYQRLKSFLKERKISTLLADGEAGPVDHALLAELENRRLLDVRLNDIQDLGFSGWRKLMPQLQKSQTLASPHAWGSQLKTNIIGHLCAAYGNTASIEGVTCISEDVDFGSHELSDGRLVLSSEPGFGMKLLKN